MIVNHHRFSFFSCLFCLSLLSPATLSWAREEDQFHEETIPKDYPDDYIFLQLNQDVPLGPSALELKTGHASYGIEYHHHLGDHWIVGVGYRVKSFIRKSGPALSLLTLSNHTQRVFRVYYPLYLLIGTEWSYLMPTAQISLPLVKEPDYATEIGVGLNTSLWLYLQPHLLIELRTQRWRGTKTNRLHGWESSLGLGYAF